MKFLFLYLLLFFCLPLPALEKCEPSDGRILHGMGQYVPIYRSAQDNLQLLTDYQNAADKVPAIYSVYSFLDPILDQMDSTDLNDIVTNHGYPYVLLVGYILMDSSYLNTLSVNIPFQDIINSSLDSSIVKMAGRLKAIPAPVFFRPGFEFGTGNSGIHNDPDVGPADFINIWQHIYTIFQQQNVTNIVWVWSTVNPQEFNYSEWYPGDEYVDWWGINYFTNTQLASADAFLNDAAAHGKPVIVCESNPIENDGTTNPGNWDLWFVPYFNKIKSFQNIKAFVYVNDPWDQPPFFDWWPDSRITSNTVIQQNYRLEMSDSVYIHMDEYLTNPGIIGDYIPPAPAADFSGNPGDQQIYLTWMNPDDPDFAGTRILRKFHNFPANPEDGFVIYSGDGVSYTDTGLINDTTYYYAAFTYDTIPNYSAPVLFSGTPAAATSIQQNEHLESGGGNVVHVFPNPFNSRTLISLKIEFPREIAIHIYDIRGKKVFGKNMGRLKAGFHSIPYDAGNLTSGVYFCRIDGGTFQLTRKLLLLK